LFVEIYDRYWILIYPFIQTVTRSPCKKDEIYFVNKWDDNKKETLKSSERGHCSELSDTAEDLSVGIPASEGKRINHNDENSE
jgi:hypothetical protein